MCPTAEPGSQEGPACPGRCPHCSGSLGCTEGQARRATRCPQVSAGRKPRGADVRGAPWVGCFRGRYLLRQGASGRRSPLVPSVGAHLLGFSGHPLPTPARLPPETPAQTMMSSHLASMSGAHIPHYHLNPPGDPKTPCFDQSHLKDGKTEARQLALMFSVGPELACGGWQDSGPSDTWHPGRGGWGGTRSWSHRSPGSSP